MQADRRSRLALPLSGQMGSIVGCVALWLLVSALHYLSPSDSLITHNVFRRLYYIPIVLAAFAGGLRFSVAMAVLVTIAYTPHAFLLHPHHDPAPNVDKLLEIVLYFCVGGLVGALVDRERKAISREKEEAKARLAAESRAARLTSLVTLSRGLAHEIRNPLGGIQGAIEILADEIPEESPRREMVDVGIRETSRLNRVLTQFLEFARPRQPVMEPFNPGLVVRDVVRLERLAAQEASIQLVGQVDVGCDRALGDREQITQVLLNLVRNGRQATAPSGRVTVRCGRLYRRGAGLIRFEVEDSGEGIPDTVKTSLYDPYVSTRDHGSGLGLSISSMLIKAHGGTIEHAERPGGGTVFRFDLEAAPDGASP